LTFLRARDGHRWLPAQATTYYGDDRTYAGDDGDDYSDDVASRAEMGGVVTFFGRPAFTVWSPHRPQPTMPREMTRAMTPITMRRRATMCAARVRDTDLSSRHRLWRLLVSEGPTVDRTVCVHGPVALSLLTRPRAVEEDVGSPPSFTVGSPRRPLPTTTTRPPMIARTATTTQRTHPVLTTPTVTPSAQNQYCRGASLPRLNHGLHAIDATPARWRGGVVSLRSIQPARRHSRRERTW
jgi:hypothetical protein